jgi:arginyl-tRNA synthetase
LLRKNVQTIVSAAVESLKAKGALPAALTAPVLIEDPRNTQHGDFACNFALLAAKSAGMNPRALAELLAAELEGHEMLQSVEVAGPGFLNLRMQPATVSSFVPRILALGSSLPRTAPEDPKRINVEFVSVNPNGPITVGSGRGAAFGDTLCRVFEAAGHEVVREYYINDGVNSEQMRLFAESVRHYYRESLGQESTFPESGYRGEYVVDVAQAVRERHGDGHAEAPGSWFQQVAQELMIERQKGDLHLFKVVFDVWFSEQSLHDLGKVAEAMVKLESSGNAYWSDRGVGEGDDPAEEAAGDAPEMPEQGPTQNALWLRSSAYGDDKDRVLVRADGRPAYIAADVAYLESKLGDRSFDRAYMILGPDHHGYVARMNAVCQALGYDLDQFEVVIFQIVRFLRDGNPAPMRKRDGNIYELRDLIHELGQAAAPGQSLEEQKRVGADVARFFYLMRSHDTHMDFDIDLATKQSDENPVFYAQYAHARISSVLRKAEEAGLKADPGLAERRLEHPRELTLIKKILDLPEEVRRCSVDHGVHRLTTYAVELARAYHHFYDACRVIQPDHPELSAARLALCEAARSGLKATFDLLGISAPETM